jgi:hypothetical protein
MYSRYPGDMYVRLLDVYVACCAAHVGSYVGSKTGFAEISSNVLEADFGTMSSEFPLKT